MQGTSVYGFLFVAFIQRPCDHAAGVPAVPLVHERSASDSVHRQSCVNIPVAPQRRAFTVQTVQKNARLHGRGAVLGSC